MTTRFSEAENGVSRGADITDLTSRWRTSKCGRDPGSFTYLSEVNLPIAGYASRTGE
jgi:hypothetical protein